MSSGYFENFKIKISSDVGILLAMVVFMDQLAAQMPPMPDKVPIIGTVSLFRMISNSHLFSVFCCLDSYHYKLGYLNNHLPTVTLHYN